MEKKLERYVYIDNLRLLMIVFVVMMHLAVTYSGFGSWYYNEGAGLNIPSAIVFGYLQSYTQAYFMGFLFLIAGFFTPGAFDRKGFKKFLKGRFVRLGIPTLIFMLIIHPFTEYFLLGFNWRTSIQAFSDYYLLYLQSVRFLGESGPLWFAFALLIFSCIYALVRLIRGEVVQKTHPQNIRVLDIGFLILLISMGAFCIRLVQPIDTSIMNMQLCYFSQYIILFITGIYAYRNNWFSTIKNRFGRKWITATFFGGIIPWLAIMIGGGALDGLYVYKGGMNWQSASFALWESFVSVSMAIGLIVLFRENFNRQNKLVKILSDNYFTVYVFHTPIIVYLSLLLKGVILPPLVKWLFMCIIGIPICFAVTHFFIRKIPFLNKVI